MQDSKAPTVNQGLQELYDNYYTNDDRLAEKRRMTGIHTMRRIRSVWPTNKKAESILDVGGGEGSLLYQLDKAGFSEELYAVEISKSGIDEIRNKRLASLREVKLFDGYMIPYEDKRFDVGISVHVLEHVEHERLFLKEMKRVCKNLIIEVPLEHNISVRKAIRAGAKHGHLNFYAEETFTNLLSTVGLKVKHIKIAPMDLDYEIFISGKMKGYLRYFAKAVLSKFSNKLVMCMCTVYCEQDT